MALGLPAASWPSSGFSPACRSADLISGFVRDARHHGRNLGHNGSSGGASDPRQWGHGSLRRCTGPPPGRHALPARGTMAHRRPTPAPDLACPRAGGRWAVGLLGETRTKSGTRHEFDPRRSGRHPRRPQEANSGHVGGPRVEAAHRPTHHACVDCRPAVAWFLLHCLPFDAHDS